MLIFDSDFYICSFHDNFKVRLTYTATFPLIFCWRKSDLCSYFKRLWEWNTEKCSVYIEETQWSVHKARTDQVTSEISSEKRKKPITVAARSKA
jgi:hypothetical protein